MSAPAPLVAVAPGVHVAVSRRYASLSTVIEGGDGTALVIDPNWDADELAALPPELARLGLRCALGLATHVHYDHVLWHPGLGDVPRFASRWTAWATEHERESVLAPLVGDLPPELIELAGLLTPLDGGRAPEQVPPASTPRGDALPDPYVLPWTAMEIVLHEHDAHAPAHLAVELVDAGVLVAGDLGSDTELPMPDDLAPDFTTYLQALDLLAPVAARCSLLIPGHGTPSSRPLERLDADRRYLDDLLTRGDSDDPRIADPENASLHEANRRRARSSESGPVPD